MNELTLLCALDSSKLTLVEADVSTRHTTWYKQPATRWLDGFPIGSGTLGAMVMGGIEEERLALNHDRLWRGRSRNRTTEEKSQYLPEIRKRFFAGDLKAAGEFANKLLCGLEHAVEPFQPFGDLTLTFAGHKKAWNYQRQLDLSQGVVSIEYSVDGVKYRRAIFASFVHCLRDYCRRNRKGSGRSSKMVLR